MLEGRDPGGPLRPFPAERQQWRRRRRPPRGTWPTRPQLCSGTQIAANAGAARRPRGPPRSRGAVVLVSDPEGLIPAAAPEEAWPSLLGPEDNRPTGCRRGTRVPVAPSRGFPREADGARRGEVVSGEMVRLGRRARHMPFPPSTRGRNSVTVRPTLSRSHHSPLENERRTCPSTLTDRASSLEAPPAPWSCCCMATAPMARI